jgi:hypothetical protein
MDVEWAHVLLALVIGMVVAIVSWEHFFADCVQVMRKAHLHAGLSVLA